MIRLCIIAMTLLLSSTAAVCQDKASNEGASSFLGKLFGKQEDFADLKKKRRQFIAEIVRIERDLKLLESQAEQLSTQLEEAPATLTRLNTQMRMLDRLIADKSSPSEKGKPPSTEDRPFAFDRLSPEGAFFQSLPLGDLRLRKTDIEQRIKDITERQQRQVSNREDQRKKRDDLEIKQAGLVELEDRIGVALSTGTNQYIYRTVVSLIFAGIVAYLVSRFFGVVQQNEEVRMSIFTGDTGIQFITLFSIVIAVILFGILEILGANELSALLGGLSGYILGKTSTNT